MVSNRSDPLNIEGEYEEINEFDDLSGVNATLGILWRASRFLSLGASVDLPWTAEATQTKTIRNRVTTYDQSYTRVMDVTEDGRSREKRRRVRIPPLLVGRRARQGER